MRLAWIVERPALDLDHNALVGIAIHQDAGHDSMEQHLNARLFQKAVGGLTPDQGIMGNGEGLAVDLRSCNAAASLQRCGSAP